MTNTLTHGNSAVVINAKDGSVWANLYVNARDGIDGADITNQRWTGKTVAAAEKWAKKVLG
jgi:hypothetical protein